MIMYSTSMHRSKALVYRMSSYFKTRRVRYQANLSTAWYDLHEKPYHFPQIDLSTAWYNLNMES
jgi:hypothetical protein